MPFKTFPSYFKVKNVYQDITVGDEFILTANSIHQKECKPGQQPYQLQKEDCPVYFFTLKEINQMTA